MPSSCVAYNCTARYKKGVNVKFHTFPKLETLKAKWVESIRRADFKPTSASKICSNHFKEDDYYFNPHGTKVLKKDSVPSIFSLQTFPTSKKKESKEEIISTTVEVPVLESSNLNYHKEKMRVKLAVEMFSASVADALEYCNKDLNIPQFKGSEALVKYCRLMNDIFDLLNSRNFLNKVISKKPLSLENEAFIKDKIDISIKYLSNLLDQRGNLIIMSQRKTGFLGLIICLTSVSNLFDELIKTEKLKFMCTYKLSQDHLEMFFSLMRSRGGFNNNPTAMQFEGAYKRVLIHTELHCSDAVWLKMKPAFCM